MYFENHLTEADMVRVHQTVPKPPPTLLAGSYLSLLEAIDSGVGKATLLVYAVT